MGASVVDKDKSDGGFQMLFWCGIKVPQQAKLLQSPNVWIADTGATMHSSPYKQGMENIWSHHSWCYHNRKWQRWKGRYDWWSQVDNVQWALCSVGTGIIRDVAHYLLSVICLQGGHCNLFSVTKLLKDAGLLELTRVHCAYPRETWKSTLISLSWLQKEWFLPCTWNEGERWLEWVQKPR